MKFGIAGYPPAFFTSPYKKDRLNIFEWLHRLDLDAYEAQMTYGPRTSPENCKVIRALSAEHHIKVSVHAAYYIVLTSNDSDKIRRSIDMLKKIFELADLMGAEIVVLHPGSNYGKNPDTIQEILCENLNRFFTETGQSHIGLFLETAGKKGQFGSVEEILTTVRQVKGCFPCIDFGHVHARNNGALNTPESIDHLFSQLKENGFLEATSRIHFHYTPIEYGEKGEITHKTIEERNHHPHYETIVENFHHYRLPVTVISETHDSQERGAMAMKNYYRSLCNF